IITVAVTFRPELLAHSNDAAHNKPMTRSERLASLNMEKKKLLSQGYGDKHPAVLQVNEAIKKLEDFGKGQTPDAKPKDGTPNAAGDAKQSADTALKDYADVLMRDLVRGVPLSGPKDDYEVLGDLLVRQNKAQEAIDAYKRA